MFRSFKESLKNGGKEFQVLYWEEVAAEVHDNMIGLKEYLRSKGIWVNDDDGKGMYQLANGLRVRR